MFQEILGTGSHIEEKEQPAQAEQMVRQLCSSDIPLGRNLILCHYFAVLSAIFYSHGLCYGSSSQSPKINP